MTPTVELHLGDCLDILPTLAAGSVGAVITDPPYGTGAWLRPDAGAGSNPVAVFSLEQWDVWDMRWLDVVLKLSPCVVTFVPSVRLTEVWNLRKPARLLMWTKPDPRPRFQGQPAYGFEPIVALGGLQGVGGMDYRMESTPRLNRDADGTGHPHQKPIGVMEWLVELACPVGGTVLDPFMGSGTTGVACMKLGRNFIGIEREESYFKIAQRRIADAQAQLALPLFE